MTTTSWCLPIICTALTYEQEDKCIKLLISYACLYPIQFSLLTVIIAWSISIIPISWIIIASIATITLLIAVSLIPITLVPVIAITLIPILTLSYRRENHPQNPILVHTTYLECVHTKVVCVVLTAASSTSASSSIATSSSTTTELLLLVHFFWLCYFNLTLQIKNKEEYVKHLRAALSNLSTWRSQRFLWRQRRCTCCAAGPVSSTNTYPRHLIYCATWAKVSHYQPFKEATAFKAFYPAYSLPSVWHHGRGAEATFPVGATAAFSPGTTSRTRLLLSHCFPWHALNKQGSGKCTRMRFPGSHCTPYTMCIWMDCTKPLPLPEITIYQILIGKTNQNWHSQDKFPGCSSSCCQPNARFLVLYIQD